MLSLPLLRAFSVPALSLILFSLPQSLPAAEPLQPATNHPETCAAPGQWLDRQLQPLTSADVFPLLNEASIVLLGEQHTLLEHHRWQLHMLSGLYASRPQLVIGLEMLPREVQPVLDAWVAGNLSESEFLIASEWNQHWGYNPDLYRPILHFARMHQIPMRALNLRRDLITRLAHNGWESVPPEERYHIDPPAPASQAYLQRLDTIYQQHPTSHSHDSSFERFVAGQLAWDRAMAHGLAEIAREGHVATALIGSGHLYFGDGVAFQLQAMGLENVRTALPWNTGEYCQPPEPGIADLVFMLSPPGQFEPQRQRPLLGVRIETVTEGIRIVDVVADSIAATSGLMPGDLVLRAAGQPLQQTGDLVAKIQAQPPGTWLPLDILRDGENLEIVARFPPPASADVVE